MPLLFIHASNAVFHARDGGAEYAVAEDALFSGVRSAVALVADEIYRGERSAAIEISVETENGTQVLRSVVAVSVSPLIIAAPTTRARMPVDPVGS